MSDEDPTVIAIYELVATGFLRVAEFRLGSAGVVELTLTEPGGCPLARHWFEEGIATADRQRLCTPADGADFLSAVLRAPVVTYTRIVNESGIAESASKGVHGGCAAEPTPWSSRRP
ncbi:hypothetical protein AB0M34_03165 [Nocardia sp. NPDC050193]